jgi:Holliday junction DNA helicase RuvA
MREGETAALHIYTSVREDAIELFGFPSELEQQLFETLISVTGVGPRMALGMLSAMSVREIASAARDDGARLQAIPGIGRKTAQRIALEVGEKLQELALAAAAEQPAEADAMADVLEGLVALGYSRNDARRAAQEARKSLPRETSAAALLKEAQNVLNR